MTTTPNSKTVQKQLDLTLAYKRTFGGPEGEAVLFDLMAKHFNRSSFSKDALEMAFREGERNIVLKILTMLNLDYETLKRKVEEAHDKAR